MTENLPITEYVSFNFDHLNDYVNFLEYDMKTNDVLVRDFF